MNSYKLNTLKARHGIDKKAIGRGIGSGCGKTSGYGHKGGKARSGRGKVSWFEGGQMPLYRRLPKRGFNSRADKSQIAIINLIDLQQLCDDKVFAAGANIGIEDLKKAHVIREKANNVRLLATGELKTALNISVNYASDAAMKAVDAAGGKVQII
jgi:large subunit ribosomal protein L15